MSPTSPSSGPSTPSTSSGSDAFVAFVCVAAASALVAFVGLGVAGASAGCGPTCTGDKQGTTGCSCGSDQDCATKNAVVFLCKSGSCEAGTPPAAPGTHCTKDADCGNGGGCSADDVCVAAPSCERIDEKAAPLSFLSSTGATDVVTASHTDCAHAWSASGGGNTLDVNVTIALDGTMTVTDNGSSPACASGVWSAADRLGEITCGAGATQWAIGPSDVVAKACFGTAQCSACNSTSTVGDGVGVCP